MQVMRAETPTGIQRPHPRAAGFAFVDSYQGNRLQQDFRHEHSLHFSDATATGIPGDLGGERLP